MLQIICNVAMISFSGLACFLMVINVKSDHDTIYMYAYFINVFLINK